MAGAGLRCVLLLTLPGVGQTGPGRGDDRGLEQRLNQLTAGFHGKAAIYAEQLNTGRVVAIDADRPVQTASVIKLAVLYEAMEQVRSGQTTWERKVTLAPGDAVTGSGVLAFFDAPLQLTLKYVLSMMVIGDESRNRDAGAARDQCPYRVARAEGNAPLQEGDEAGDGAYASGPAEVRAG